MTWNRRMVTKGVFTAIANAWKGRYECLVPVCRHARTAKLWKLVATHHGLRVVRLEPVNILMASSPRSAHCCRAPPPAVSVFFCIFIPFACFLKNGILPNRDYILQMARFHRVVAVPFVEVWLEGRSWILASTKDWDALHFEKFMMRKSSIFFKKWSRCLNNLFNYFNIMSFFTSFSLLNIHGKESAQPLRMIINVYRTRALDFHSISLEFVAWRWYLVVCFSL